MRDRFNGVDGAIFSSNIPIASVILIQAFVPAPGGHGVFPVKSFMPGSVDRPGPSRRDIPGIDPGVMDSFQGNYSHPCLLSVLCFFNLGRNGVDTE
jgi:hypothetical protein